MRSVSESTGRPPSSSSMPTASRSWPSNTGRRPAATRSSSARRAVPPASEIVHPRPSCSARSIVAARQEPDPLFLQRGDERSCRVLVLGRQDLRERLDRGDRRAEPRVDLGELDADRPGADHREGARWRVRPPDRLPIRPVGAVGEPRDRGDRGLGPGGEHDAIGLELGPVLELDPTVSDQARLLEVDRDARVLERPGALARSGVDHLPGPPLDRRVGRPRPRGCPRRTSTRPARAGRSSRCATSPWSARSRSGCTRRRACRARRSRPQLRALREPDRRPPSRCRRRRSRRRRTVPSRTVEEPR